ncbi:uncharacterized protein LOC135352703 [Latimeria chalumnae]|uniref:uncharacterized protein LOC135352703 n=1 Tax=Latimeria chalumnae TaxID=7897 RepID=UPI00313E9A06
MPTVDQSFLTYFSSKLGKDPRKGLDRSLKGVQDKLLDISSPLTKILGIAEDAIARHEVPPQQLLNWAQRCVWMLGNANAALSTERRRNFLIKISPHFTDLASKDFGPEAKGLLFGDPFLKELSRTVKTFSSLDHAASSLRKSLAPQVFGRAGGYRGPPSGRTHIPPQQAPRGPARGSFHRGAFRPRGSRPDSRGRGSAPASKYPSFRSKGPQPYLVSGSTSLGPDPILCGSFWTNSVLLPQLGKNNQRPLGARHHSRLSTRVLILPGAIHFTSGGEILFRQGGPYPPRIKHLSAKASDFPYRPQGNPRVHHFDLVPKKDSAWRPIITSGPSTISSCTVTSNGGFPSPLGHTPIRRLDGAPRPKRRVLYDPYPSSGQIWLTFRWEGRLWEFNCLPFGLSSAPWCFTKVMKPVVAWFRALGIRMIIWTTCSLCPRTAPSYPFSWKQWCQSSRYWGLLSIGRSQVYFPPCR